MNQLKSLITLTVILCSTNLYAQRGLVHLNNLGTTGTYKGMVKYAAPKNGEWFQVVGNASEKGVLLPAEGQALIMDYNYVDGSIVIKEINLGSAAYLKRAYANFADNTNIKTNRTYLPFGLRIGMSRAEVEKLAGGSFDLKYDMGFGSWSAFSIPGFVKLNLLLTFKHDELHGMRLTLYDGAGFAHRKLMKRYNFKMPSLAEIYQAKKLRSQILTLGSIFNFIAFDSALQYEPEQWNNPRQRAALCAQFAQTLGASGSAHSKDKMDFTFCIDRLEDQNAFYNEIWYYLNVFLNDKRKNYQEFDNVQWGKDYFDYEESSYNQRLTYTGDNTGFASIHLYKIDRSNELVLSIHTPAYHKLQKRPVFTRVCTAEDKSLLLDDAALILSQQIDKGDLRSMFTKSQVNWMLRYLGWPRGDLPRLPSNVESKTKGGLLTDHPRCVTEVVFDLEGSYRYKGKLPFKLKPGMRESSFQKKLKRQGFETTSAYRGIKATYTISKDLKFSLYGRFRKKRLVEVSIVLSEEEARGRIWNLIRDDILPQP